MTLKEATFNSFHAACVVPELSQSEGKEKGSFRAPHPLQERRGPRGPPVGRFGRCLEEHCRWWLDNIRPESMIISVAEDVHTATIKLTINTIFPLKFFGDTLESSISSNLDSMSLFLQVSLMIWMISSWPSTSTRHSRLARSGQSPSCTVQPMARHTLSKETPLVRV